MSATEYLWGAAAIAAEAGIFDDDGKPDEKRTYYLLENQLIPARKVGRIWVSSRSRIRRALGDIAEPSATGEI
jgi:hypothetical protein